MPIKELREYSRYFDVSGRGYDLIIDKLKEIDGAIRPTEAASDTSDETVENVAICEDCGLTLANGECPNVLGHEATTMKLEKEQEDGQVIDDGHQEESSDGEGEESSKDGSEGETEKSSDSTSKSK